MTLNAPLRALTHFARDFYPVQAFRAVFDRNFQARMEQAAYAHDAVAGLNEFEAENDGLDGGELPDHPGYPAHLVDGFDATELAQRVADEREVDLVSHVTYECSECGTKCPEFPWEHDCLGPDADHAEALERNESRPNCVNHPRLLASTCSRLFSQFGEACPCGDVEALRLNEYADGQSCAREHCLCRREWRPGYLTRVEHKRAAAAHMTPSEAAWHKFEESPNFAGVAAGLPASWGQWTTTDPQPKTSPVAPENPTGDDSPAAGSIPPESPRPVAGSPTLFIAGYRAAISVLESRAQADAKLADLLSPDDPARIHEYAAWVMDLARYMRFIEPKK